MKERILIFMALVMYIWSDDTIQNGMPIASPILSVYPCHDSKDVVVWFEPGLPLRDRNQYYLYINKYFPDKCSIETKFNADVNIILNIRTDNNTYVRHSLRNGSRTTNTFRKPSPYMSTYGYKVEGTSPGIVPYLTSLKINGVEYCNQPNVGFLDPYISSNIDYQTPWNCGRRKVLHTELIVGGAETKPGDWPWHTAIYRLDSFAIKYICGGSLISTHLILTAAHCTDLRGLQVLPELLSVVLGKYNLIGGDIGSQEREVHRIIAHDKFQRRYLHNDIALLKLKAQVIFTDYIQPACLWYDKADEKLLNTKIVGTIVGWGFDSNYTLSRTMKQTKMPMVTNNVCMESQPNFYPSILNDNKFCAGYRNRSSACNGDSGSSFQVYVPDTVRNGMISNSGAWLIRGIVSIAMSQKDAPVCDPEQYVVFTDVAKYLDWIQKHLDED